MDEADNRKLKKEVKGTEKGNITKEKQHKELKESYEMGVEYYEEILENNSENK